MLGERGASVAACDGVKLVRCEGEADVEIGLACSTFVRRGWDAYILAQDSDFLIHADVRYVPFEELSLTPLGRAASGAPLACVAMGRVWSRSLLAELSGLSEERVVEWAMLCGNDATAPLFAPHARH